MIDAPADAQCCFAFVLIPGFSMVTFSCAIDGLRTANQLLGHDYYSWQVLSPTGGTIHSSSQIGLSTEPLESAYRSDFVVVCGGNRSHEFHDKNLTVWLHKRANEGQNIGAISDGSFILAESGLFKNCPSTIHWKCFDSYRERFPELEIKPSIVMITDKRFSCAGGTASLDLMLHFIGQTHGADIASQIAYNFFLDTIRDGESEQHITNLYHIARQKPALSKAMLLMEKNLEKPLTMDEIARDVGISRRHLDRAFLSDLGCTPSVFYRKQRLNRASGLLVQTTLNISEIAIASGFQSSSQLALHFHRQFGMSPKAWRSKHLGL